MKPTPKTTPKPKSLRAYCGEYLVSPYGLHLGFNACSHSCFYCFANLNMPNRRFNLASVRNALNDKSSTLEAWLLANRFGVLIANDSDPLAASNIDQFMVVADMLNERGIPWGAQTKGGPAHGQRVILDGPPRMVYVSLTSDDPEILAKAEPGAPGFEQRLDLCRDAVAAGHFVIAGINPLVPGWWDDPLAIAEHLHRAGVTRAWVGGLHLNVDQVRNIKPRAKEEFPLEVKLAQTRGEMAGYQTAVAAMTAAGICCYDGCSPNHQFWDGLDTLGFRAVPLADQFFQRVRQEGAGQPVLVAFSAFDQWANTADYPAKSILKEYARPFRRDVYNRTGQELSVRSMSEVNALMWDWVTFPRSPLYCPQWYLAVAGDGGHLADDEGNKYFVYEEHRSVIGSALWDLEARPVSTILE